MRKTIFVACCLFAVTFWFGSPRTSDAWTLAPENGQSAQYGAQQDALPQGQSPNGGGGFGMQILPVLLVGVVAWLLIRRLTGGGRGPHDDQDGRSGQGPSSGGPTGPDPYSREDDPANLQEAYRRARAQWEWMTSDPKAGKGGSRTEARAGATTAGAGGSGGFDKAEFLRGAKLVYARLTEAFDNLDADAAEPFATQAVLDGLRARAASGAQPGKTEIVLVEAELLEHSHNDDSEEAVVLYDALVRRGPDAAEPEQLKQVWRFGRDPREPGSTWRLVRMEPYSDPASA